MTLDEFTSLNIFFTISSIQYDKNELIIINIESEKEQLIIERAPKATLHSFRRTFNNALRDLGLQIQDRQALLAHASAETTKVYTNPNLELARRYVNQIPKMQNVTKT